MSAWIVSNKSINRIVTFMVNGNEGQHGIPYVENIPFSGRLKDADGFAQKLRDMNVKSITQRYGDDGAESMKPDKPYEFSPEKTSPWQVLKSIHCFLYQCDEGDVPKSSLYKKMATFATELALSLVQDSDEYSNVKWE